MKVGLRYGHSVNCRGASGKIDEVTACKTLFGKVKLLLERFGHTVVECNSSSNTIDGELSEGTRKANNANVDIYITLHMNAFNGNARGVECWVYDRNSPKAIQIGTNICTNISSLGTPNRGVKYNSEYHDLRMSNMQAVIVETLFCDNADDASIFNTRTDEIALGIVSGIDNSIPNNSTVFNPVSYEMQVNGAYYGKTDVASIAKAVEKELNNGVSEITLIKRG